MAQNIFRQIYKYKQCLIDAIFSNSNLVKYLAYDNTDPLSNNIFKNPYLLINDRLFFKPKDYKIIKDTKSILFINFKVYKHNNSSIFKEINITMDLLIHNSLIEIDGIEDKEDRAINILEELQKGIDGQSIGIGKTILSACVPIYTNDDMVSYRMEWVLTDFGGGNNA